MNEKWKELIAALMAMGYYQTMPEGENCRSSATVYVWYVIAKIEEALLLTQATEREQEWTVAEERAEARRELKKAQDELLAATRELRQVEKEYAADVRSLEQENAMLREQLAELRAKMKND